MTISSDCEFLRNRITGRRQKKVKWCSSISLYRVYFLHPPYDCFFSFLVEHTVLHLIERCATWRLKSGEISVRCNVWTSGPHGMNCTALKMKWRVHLATSFHLLGSHQGREVPSLQSHQETPEHTKRQDSHVTRGGNQRLLCHMVCQLKLSQQK